MKHLRSVKSCRAIALQTSLWLKVLTDDFPGETFPSAFQMSGQLTQHQFSPIPTSCYVRGNIAAICGTAITKKVSFPGLRTGLVISTHISVN